MTQNLRMLARPALLLAIAITAHPEIGRAQVRTIETGAPPADTSRPARSCLTDSLLNAALAAYNAPTTTRVVGGLRMPAGDTTRGSYGLYQGALVIGGTVRGGLAILDGDARLLPTAVVSGDVIVLGGHLTVDPGARVAGKRIECADPAPVTQLANGTMVVRQQARSLSSIASGIGYTIAGVRFSPHVIPGEYNRVEGLPLELGFNAAKQTVMHDTARAQLYAIFRTARDPTESRSTVGWHGRFEYVYHDAISVTAGIEAGSTVVSTVDRPFGTLESGLSTLLLRRDYHDWYLRRGGSIYATLQLNRDFSFAAAIEASRQTTVLATDAFSILRSNEAWRPNPLIDDGKYRIAALRVMYDARDEREHPVLGWYGRLEIRDVTSNDLTPISLPTSIRNVVPSTGYAEQEGDLDVRAYLRLKREQRVNLRLFAGGYLGGDPLTIQRRRAIGGGDPLAGYDFRAVNCDNRRMRDPSTPALCDREMAVQAEYHRVLPIDLNTRVGSYTVGIRKPELVLFADAGSAWLAGDSAGRVPANRIQTPGEWRSDIGAGITTNWAGVYIAKALADPVSLKVLLLFNRRF